MHNKKTGNPVSRILKDRSGVTYITWMVILVALLMIMSCVLSFTLAVEIVEEQRSQVKHVLDKRLDENAIYSFGNLKDQNDYTDAELATIFIQDLIDDMVLEEAGEGRYLARKADGNVKYYMTEPDFSYMADNEPKVVISYVLSVPITFAGTDVAWADVPVQINALYEPKFEDSSSATDYDLDPPVITIIAPDSSNSAMPTLSYEEVYTVRGTVRDYGSGIKRLLIGGSNIPVNADGTWSVQIKLTEYAITQVSITAVDNRGNMAQETRFVKYDPNGADPDPYLPEYEYDDFFIEINAPANTPTLNINVSGYAFSPKADISYVTVNGETAILNSDGTFTAEVRLDGTEITATAYDEQGNHFGTKITYREILVDKENRLHINYRPHDNELLIPATVRTKVGNYYKIVGLADAESAEDGVFANCTHLNKVTMPESFTHIGDYAFYGCTGLKGNLSIPDGVKKIGFNAFANCKELDGTLTLSESLEVIGERAFDNCYKMTGSLVIPDNVISVGNYAFYSCSKFSSLKLGTSLKTIGDHAFRYCSGLTGSLVIPDSVTSIGAHAFQNLKFTGNLKLGSSLEVIGANAFAQCKGFTGSLIIPDSITTIGGAAFYQCSGLSGSLLIPDKVETIGTNTFANCTGFDGTLTLGSGLKTIGQYAFSKCNGFTGSLIIPDSVTTIEQSAFEECAGFNGELDLGNVQTIGNNAFIRCSGLTGSIVIPDTTLSVGSGVFSGCSGFNGTLNLGNSVQTIGVNAFSNCSGLTGSLVIPDSVTAIGGSAFSRCTGFNGTLVLGSGLTDLDTYAFQECKGLVGDIIIPNKITTLNNYVFYNCTGFDGSVVIPEGVNSIGNQVFYGATKLKSIQLPSSITSIGTRAFSNPTSGNGRWYSKTNGTEYNMNTTKFPTGVADTYTSTQPLTISMNLPSRTDSVSFSVSGTVRGGSGTYNTVQVNGVDATVNPDGTWTAAIQLTGLEITATATDSDGATKTATVQYETFSVNQANREFIGYSADATSLNIPATFLHTDGKYHKVVGIDNGRSSTGAFANCSNLTSITLPDSLTYIGGYAFAECYGLSGTLIIPDSVKQISGYAFSRCDGLSALDLGNGVEIIENDAFSECYGLSGSLVIPDSVKIIEDGAFRECSGLNGTLTLGNNLETIGGSAFEGCSGFTGSLTIPNNVTSISNYAFEGCSGFTGSLTIPDSVTSIGSFAFYGCSGFTGSLTIPDGVTSIGSSAFYHCSGLTGSLTIPDSVTSIGNYAFYYCSGFTGSLTIPNSVTSIGTYAFYCCSGFTGSLTIPNSVTSIGTHAFYNCSGFDGSLTLNSGITQVSKYSFAKTGFTQLIIQNGVNTIDTYAFNACDNLETMTLPSSITTIGSYAFSSMTRNNWYSQSTGTKYTNNNIPVGVADTYSITPP